MKNKVRYIELVMKNKVGYIELFVKSKVRYLEVIINRNLFTLRKADINFLYSISIEYDILIIMSHGK